eukprot:3134512-Amphidinium_carterae.1
MFPSEWTDKFPFPLLEDLLNQSPFVDLAQWMHRCQLANVTPGAAAMGSRAQQKALDFLSAAPLDLKFAVQQSLRRSRNSRQILHGFRAQLKELAHRCRPLTRHLLQFQSLTVRAVAGNVHVDLMAVLTIPMKWPDVNLPLRFITGSRTTGVMERTGVHAPIDAHEPVSVSEVFVRMAASPDMQFLWDSCCKESEAGWAT